MDENQQDFQPIIVGVGRDSVVQRSTSMDNGPYAQRTSYHADKLANITELPQ